MDILTRTDLNWIPKVRQILPYRRRIFTKPKLLASVKDIVSETESEKGIKGVVLKIVQYANDYYRPKDDSKVSDETFFNLNSYLTEVRTKQKLSEKNPLLACLYQLYKDNYVIHHYELSEIFSLQWISRDNYDMIESLGINELDGHIKQIKSDKPFYEGQQPIETYSGMRFYHKSEFHMKPSECKEKYFFINDIDYRYDALTDEDLNMKKIHSIRTNKGYDIATELPDGETIIELT